MAKLKLIFKIMVILGFISFIAGILVTMKELMEYGLCIGITGIIGYAIMFVMSSTSPKGRKSIYD
jgi:hypothetical protein